MKTETKHAPGQWVIEVNGGYFDGMYGGRPLAEAKRYTRTAARAINHTIMCGNGKIRLVSKAEGRS